jgi:hypothetical protein
MTRTSVAVLGTLTEFHDDPIPYDLSALIDLVKRINPDLLCLDITMAQWQAQDFSNLPPEYRDALLPLAYQSDIVVAPIAGNHPAIKAEGIEWNGRFIQELRRILSWVQNTAPSPDAVNQGWRHHLSDYLYSIIRMLSGNQIQQNYHERIESLTQSVLKVAEHNPGNRILVVTNIQYCHHIRPRLRATSDIQVTTYKDL